MATSGPQNGQRRLKGGFWALSSTFANSFCDMSTPSMRNGGKKGGWENNDRNGSHNVVASRQPERR